MSSHWALLDIQYHHSQTGYILCITTNTPCHLYMRWTIIEPQLHLDPVYKRGLAIHGEPRYCFVVFEDNEQEEAGDTLIHTFLKPNWDICITRFFYFWGTINGLFTPSESPIFEKHRTAPEYAVIFYELWSS